MTRQFQNTAWAWIESKGFVIWQHFYFSFDFCRGRRVKELCIGGSKRVLKSWSGDEEGIKEANLCATVANNALRELLISFGLHMVTELALTRRCIGFLPLFAFLEIRSFIIQHIDTPAKYGQKTFDSDVRRSTWRISNDRCKC